MSLSLDEVLSGKTFTAIEPDPEPEDTAEPLSIRGFGDDDVARTMFAQHFVTPMVDVYLRNEIFVWAKLIHDGFDLTPERCAHESIGRMERIFDYELTEGGLEGILFYDATHSDHRWMDWALIRGIAPGQPFLVWIGRPHHYSYWTDCGTEYDTDIDTYVIRTLPATPQRAARAWDKATKRIRENEEARDRQRAWIRDLELRSIDAMFIRASHYYSGHYDEMCPPNGVSYTIHSDHRKIPALKTRGFGWGGQIASARDDDGDHEKVMRRLIAAAQAVVPALDEATIRKMPHRW